jgi:exopolyphosphatase/guanosine-5'-triphosphate,3'-diphosphate pyrophosphatase
MPALKIYMSVMKWGGIRSISVPQIGLADGLVRIMHRDYIRSRSRRMDKPSKKKPNPSSKTMQTRLFRDRPASVTCRL